MAYRKLSLLLHPDKTCHSGATEAFKILQHANDNLLICQPPSMAALKINKDDISVTISNPPRVISIQTGKKTISKITTISSKKMDMRTKLFTMVEDPDGLSQHVLKVLNDCWERREVNGDIAGPEGTPGVEINCIKHVKSAFHWYKEVQLIGAQNVGLNITVKEVREKTDDDNGWMDCIEVDLKFSEDDINDGRSTLASERYDRPQMTSEDLVNRWVVMKNYIGALFGNDE